MSDGESQEGSIDFTAESSVVATILSDSSALEDVEELLSPEDFSVGHLRSIFAAAQQAYRQSGTTDPVSVAAVLDKNKKLKTDTAANIVKNLNSIILEFSSTSGIIEHAKIVQDRAALRRVATASRKIFDTINKPGVTGADAVTAAETIVFGLDSGMSDEFSAVTTMADATVSLLAEIKSRKPGELIGIPSSIPALNEATDGFKPGDLVVIAGPSGTGKTALVTGFMLDIAEHTGQPAILMSHEMTSEEIAARCLAKLTGTSMRSILNGHLLATDEKKFLDAVERAQNINVIINDTPPRTPDRLEAFLRRANRKYQPSTVVLDFAQMISGESEVKNRSRVIEESAYMMKAYAKDGGYPAFLLSQLNRNSAGRMSKRPVNSDLKESGGLEHAANLIMFVYRPPASPDTNPDETELMITKQRNGATDISVHVLWDGPATSYSPDPRKPHPLPTSWADTPTTSGYSSKNSGSPF